MTYRPYPSPARARHQVERHRPAPEPRPLTPLEKQAVAVIEGLSAAFAPLKAAAAQDLRRWAMAARYPTPGGGS